MSEKQITAAIATLQLALMRKHGIGAGAAKLQISHDVVRLTTFAGDAIASGIDEVAEALKGAS